MYYVVCVSLCVCCDIVLVCVCVRFYDCLYNCMSVLVQHTHTYIHTHTHTHTHTLTHNTHTHTHTYIAFGVMIEVSFIS